MGLLEQQLETLEELHKTEEVMKQLMIEMVTDYPAAVVGDDKLKVFFGKLDKLQKLSMQYGASRALHENSLKDE